MSFDELFAGLAVESVESFRETATADVLKQLGASAALVKRIRARLGEAFGPDWLNGQSILPAYFAATRCGKYDLWQLLKLSGGPLYRHPLSQAWLETEAQAEGQPACCAIKCVNLGFIVLTDMTTDGTHLTVDMGAHGVYRVYRGTGFFSRVFGSDFDLDILEGI